jgi:hypothetical protein
MSSPPTPHEIDIPTDHDHVERQVQGQDPIPHLAAPPTYATLDRTAPHSPAFWGPLTSYDLEPNPVERTRSTITGPLTQLMRVSHRLQRQLRHSVVYISLADDDERYASARPLQEWQAALLSLHTHLDKLHRLTKSFYSAAEISEEVFMNQISGTNIASTTGCRRATGQRLTESPCLHTDTADYVQPATNDNATLFKIARKRKQVVEDICTASFDFTPAYAIVAAKWTALETSGLFSFEGVVEEEMGIAVETLIKSIADQTIESVRETVTVPDEDYRALAELLGRTWTSASRPDYWAE